MAWVNEELASRFAEIAALLKLKGEDAFRVRAYERASSAIGAAPADLANVPREELTTFKGIGESTAKKIVEYFDTGAIAMLTELREQIPAGVLALTSIPGLGPKTAVMLHTDLGISSVDELRAAMDRGDLAGVRGLGAKTVDNLRDALQRMGAKDTSRVPAADAIALAEEICAQLAVMPEVESVTFAGSLRRMRETIGDVDILAASSQPDLVHTTFRELGLVLKVLAAGEKKTSVVTVRGIQADLRVVQPEAWGAALQYFTGSKAHNVRVRERAVRKGLLLNEYGLYRKPVAGAGGGDDAAGDPTEADRIASFSEADVYAAMDLEFIPPPMREDQGEVEAAAAGKLPQVVTLDDLRGDLHGHTDWSGDGKASLEEMAAAAEERGYAYWAATDHAEDLTLNGLTRERMLERRVAIHALQERTGMRILDGAELNIGIEGTLDYDLDFLLAFDFCVASVHSLMKRPQAQQTARMIAACEHPAVHVIGHPTGRKLGRRPGYEIDLEAICEAARETGTALEVNASPRRLDLSGEMVRQAVAAGVTLTISCDAHSIGDLASMRYGIWTAQRGWATPADVLNCRDLDGLLAWTAAKRERA